MGFMAPWFLLGIAAVAAPLWLHLLRQFKRPPQDFSSLMFFESTPQISVKSRRLRYLTLLCLRILFLLLLALAFANPFVNRAATASSRRTLHVIAIDRSFSMRYGDRIERAKEAANRLVNQLGGQELAQVMALDSHVESLTPAQPDKGVLLAAIASVQPTDLSSSFGEFTRALRYLDQTSRMQLQVDLISDMQQSSMPKDFRELRLGPHTSVDLMNVGKGTAANWAVENVNVASRASTDGNARLTASVAGWQTETAARVVQVVLDEKVVASRNIEVPANGRTAVEFPSLAVPYGWHKGEVRVEPHDNLAADDSYAFSVQRTDPRKILFLYAADQSRARLRMDAQHNPAFFYKAAIESGPGTGLTVEPVRVGDATGMDFSKFAFVVLNDVGELEPQLSDALCDYVQKGGAVLIALGTNTALAGRIPLSKEAFSMERQRQGAGYVDSRDPAMSGGGQFENAEFFETAAITPKPDARVIAKFADGSPLLLEEQAREGRKLILASTLNNATSDFALHSSFVPFAVQTAHYLAGWEEEPASVTAGSPVRLRRTGEQGAAADVIGPDGKHLLSLSDANKALSFDPVSDGFYEVVRADGRRLLVAAHAERRESDLTAIPAETLELWRNTGSKPGQGETANTGTEMQRRSLWRYMIVVLLLAALVESVFASRYLRKEGQTA